MGINEDYKVNGYIYLNGNKYSDNILIEILEGKEFIKINDNFIITGMAQGQAKLRICMEENNEVFKEMIINVVEAAKEIIDYQLIGDESIKWGRTKVLQAVKSINGVTEPTTVTFQVEDNDELLSSFEINSSSIVLTANSENKVGTCTIKCKFEDNSQKEKVINVTSLWM